MILVSDCMNTVVLPLTNCMFLRKYLIIILQNQNKNETGSEK